jgi:hypothetical protein
MPPKIDKSLIAVTNLGRFITSRFNRETKLNQEVLVPLIKNLLVNIFQYVPSNYQVVRDLFYDVFLNTFNKLPNSRSMQGDKEKGLNDELIKASVELSKLSTNKALTEPVQSYIKNVILEIYKAKLYDIISVSKNSNTELNQKELNILTSKIPDEIEAFTRYVENKPASRKMDEYVNEYKSTQIEFQPESSFDTDLETDLNNEFKDDKLNQDELDKIYEHINETFEKTTDSTTNTPEIRSSIVRNILESIKYAKSLGFTKNNIIQGMSYVLPDEYKTKLLLINSLYEKLPGPTKDRLHDIFIRLTTLQILAGTVAVGGSVAISNKILDELKNKAVEDEKFLVENKATDIEPAGTTSTPEKNPDDVDDDDANSTPTPPTPPTPTPTPPTPTPTPTPTLPQIPTKKPPTSNIPAGLTQINAPSPKPLSPSPISVSTPTPSSKPPTTSIPTPMPVFKPSTNPILTNPNPTSSTSSASSSLSVGQSGISTRPTGSTYNPNIFYVATPLQTNTKQNTPISNPTIPLKFDSNTVESKNKLTKPRKRIDTELKILKKKLIKFTQYK